MRVLSPTHLRLLEEAASPSTSSFVISALDLLVYGELEDLRLVSVQLNVLLGDGRRLDALWTATFRGRREIAFQRLAASLRP